MMLEFYLEGLVLPEGVTGVVLKAGSGTPFSSGKGVTVQSDALNEAVGILIGNPSPRIFELPLSDTHLYKVAPDFSEGTELVDLSVSSSANRLLTDTSLVGGIKKSHQKTCVSIAGVPNSSVTADQVVEMYNNHAKSHKWQRVVKITDDMRKKINVARKQFPSKEDWEAILRGWSAHAFFSGASGQYDKIKIHTMFYKNRYEEFYHDGLEAQDKNQEADDFFAQINAHNESEDIRLRELKIKAGIINV